MSNEQPGGDDSSERERPPQDPQVAAAQAEPAAAPAPPPPPAAAPPARARRWSGRQVAVAAVIALAVVVGGGAAVYAATSDGFGPDRAHARLGPGGERGPGGEWGPRELMGPGGPMGRHERGGLGAPLGPGIAALHGEFTVQDLGGGYVTQSIQRGTVTALSPTSLTVKSDDGFTKTYKINSSTETGPADTRIADLAQGDVVTVIARADGSAISVRDRDAR